MKHTLSSSPWNSLMHVSVKKLRSCVVNTDKLSLAALEKNVTWKTQNFLFLWNLSDSSNSAIVYIWRFFLNI